MSRQPNNGGGSDRFADHVPVAERLEKFYQNNPGGRVTTEIVEHDHETGFILIKAYVYRSASIIEGPASTGHAFEVRCDSYVNKTSYVESCETSAVGRALANLGLEIKWGIASSEVMDKVEQMESRPRPVVQLAQHPAVPPVDETARGLVGLEQHGRDSP
jgi:hypothetical protein